MNCGSSVSAVSSRVRAGLFGLLFLATSFQASQAATVAIDSLLVDTASLNLVVGSNSRTYTTSVVPPALITMGAYQDPIIAMWSSGYYAKIYSTGAYGMPAPSGSVDTTAGTINVDFSSLRVRAKTGSYGTLDFAAPLITNPPSAGSYDTTTGAFELTWSNTFSFLAGPRWNKQTVYGTATITLNGTASLVPVPVPAAMWLLGSGLVGLAGIARRRSRVVA